MHLGVSVSNQLGLAPRVINLDVNYHMAFHKLVPRQNLVIIALDIEGNFHVLHFLGNGISPQSVAILLVNGISLGDSLGLGNF